MTNKLTCLLALLICVQPAISGAQSADSVAGASLDARTLHSQEKAEKLFESGKYDRAYFIYRKELAPLGDKYAQYMVGFMHLTGKSVAEDHVIASAWFRLAAERGTEEFIRVRNNLSLELTAEQDEQSDKRFVELRKKLGDLPILMRAVRRDYEKMGGRTGTRRTGERSAMPMTVIDAHDLSAPFLGDQYYGKIEDRIQARLRYISEHTQIEIDYADLQNLDLSAIEDQLDEHLDVLY